MAEMHGERGAEAGRGREGVQAQRSCTVKHTVIRPGFHSPCVDVSVYVCVCACLRVCVCVYMYEDSAYDCVSLFAGYALGPRVVKGNLSPCSLQQGPAPWL